MLESDFIDDDSDIRDLDLFRISCFEFRIYPSTYRAAVGIDDLTGDVICLVTRKESSQFRNVFREAPAFERSFISNSLLPHFAGLLPPRRTNPARRDAVHPDAGGQRNR